MLKKVQFESVIISDDREFKYRVLSFLNNSSFNAEKYNVSTLAEAKAKQTANAKIMNIIVDAKALNLNHEMAALKDLAGRPPMMVLVYTTPEGLEDLREKDHKVPNLFIRALPTDKLHFNEAFHTSREQKGKPTNPFGAPVVASTTPPPAKESAAPAKSITLVEASTHVQETVEMIRVLGKDKSKLEILAQVGQKFNGLVGAFPYFAQKDGFKQLQGLAQVIDVISRHYQEPGCPSSVEENHFKLLVASAKTSYLMLLALRENKALDPAVLQEANHCLQQYEQASELKKPDTQSQDAIDALLTNMGIGA